MELRRLSFAALAALVLVPAFVLPEPADARSYRRRNYAEEWEREEREEERRRAYEEERERQRQYDEERQERMLEHSTETQKRYIDHRERQLDQVIDHVEGGPGQPRSVSPPPQRRGGSCILGPDGKVIYQPDGVDC